MFYSGIFSTVGSSYSGVGEGFKGLFRFIQESTVPGGALNMGRTVSTDCVCSTRKASDQTGEMSTLPLSSHLVATKLLS